MWVGMGGGLFDGEECCIHAGELVAGGVDDAHSNLNLICAACLRVVGIGEFDHDEVGQRVAERAACDQPPIAVDDVIPCGLVSM